MKNCEKCGAFNADEAAVCASCGAPLDEKVKKPKNKKPLIIALIAVGAVLLMGAGVLIGLFAGGAFAPKEDIDAAPVGEDQAVEDSEDNSPIDDNVTVVSPDMTQEQLVEEWGEPDDVEEEEGFTSLYYYDLNRDVYGVKIDTAMISYGEQGEYNGALYITPDYTDDAAFETDLRLVLDELRQRAGEDAFVSVYKYDSEFENEEELEVSGFDDLPINTMLKIEGCYNVVTDTEAVTVYNIPGAKSLAINEFSYFYE